MRCIVPNCKNDSKHSSKSRGTTFHVFPNESILRSAWLQALGKEHWIPKERSAVCSDHFLCEDLYWTKNGLRKVRAGAIPIILLDSSNCDYGEPTSLKVCRICLATENRLLSIRKNKLEQAYENLTGLKIVDENNLPQNLCIECACRLHNCNKFRKKSLRAHRLMLEIIKKQDGLSMESIKTINRDCNELTSNLSSKYYDPGYVDFYMCDKTDEQRVEPVNLAELSKPTLELGKYDVDVEIKDETSNNEIYLNEIDGFINSEIIKDENSINNNRTRQIIEVRPKDNESNDLEVDNDENFVPSDGNYSSDDSVPLEKHKTLKKKKKIEKGKSMKKVRKKLEKEDPVPKIDRRKRPFLNADLNETLFTVTELSVEEQLAEIRKRQDSSNYKNSVYKCTACYKGFLDDDAYNSHMLRHTNQSGEYKCDICKTHFKHPHALRKHITAHHTQRFSCNQCPYVTTHRQTARLHERWHKGTKYKCPHCPDEFVKFTTYMGHIRIKHPSDFVCELCGYSFVSEKGIDLHKKLKHRLDNVQIPEDGPYCEVCSVRFVSVEAHRKHLSVSARHATDSDRKAREPNKTKYKTKKSRKPREPKEYRENKDLDTDEDRKLYPSQMRKAEGPIPCEQCGLQLEDSRAYHGHFRRMHPDKNRTNYPSMKSPCMCEVCGKMFQSYALLRDHTWLHTGERPFKCDSCGKAFRMKQRLVAHRRVHSQVKATYVCSVCGKHFSTHSNRQRHMFIHTGLKPFKCEMCGKGFKHASEKRAHIEYVHLKKPWPKRARGKRRQERPPPQISGPPTSASEMDIVQPIWPACDPKLAEMNVIMDDKPMYYNLKI